MERPLKFDPNTNEHLEWALKLAYKHASGDMSVTSEETMDATCDALCNLIGDEDFSEWIENGKN